MAGEDLRLALLDRELLLDAGTVGEAVHSDGALVAVWATGRTAEGTQLDDGLVVAAGMRLVKEGLRQIPVGAYATCRVDGVVLDTLQQIESHLLMRHYDGLLKSGRIKGRTGSVAAY